MEKLIELLNEREKELSPNIQVEWTELSVGINKWYLISKECWFIKRLADNDKIDLTKLDCKRYDVDIPARYYLWTYIRYSIEKEILMTLAIQDEPIKFLISILKNVEESD